MSAPRTAAALVIGNELLTGKIRDANVEVLARELFALGIAMRRVVFCPDEIDVIVDDLNDLRRRHDFVFTSGGVGPTHDDVTIAAVALAFGRQVVRSPEIERLVTEYFGERTAAGHLRLADVPEGAELVSTPRIRWPALLVENVFVLPGLPEVFVHKMALIRDRLRGDEPFVSRALHTLCEEAEIASLVEEVGRRHPDVAIGSYPRWGESSYRVALTVDGRDRERIERALAALRAALPPEQIVADEDESYCSSDRAVG